MHLIVAGFLCLDLHQYRMLNLLCMLRAVICPCAVRCRPLYSAQSDVNAGDVVCRSARVL